LDNNGCMNELKTKRKSVVKRLYAAICMVLVSAMLVSTASYAFLVLSTAPAASNVTTHISANGNLEIALGKNIAKTAPGNSLGKNNLTRANRTWGNLIDLNDVSYGLHEIILRPAVLNSAGGAVDRLHPLAYPVYGAGGRVEYIYANNMFAGVYNGEHFVTNPNEYGVRAIGTTQYHTPGTEGIFGPLSRRQEIFYQAHSDLSNMTHSSWRSLCESSEAVLRAYKNGTGISVSDFDLNAFSEKVSAVVSAANEELRLAFTVLATSKATSANNYFIAMELLEQEYPNYETISSLVTSAILQIGKVESAGKSITELRAFQEAAKQLQTVIASGTINGADGYSMEEITKTVGLIFDLEQTGFSETSERYWSKAVPGLNYHYYQVRVYDDGREDWDYELNGLSLDDLTDSLRDIDQDNGSREAAVDEIESILKRSYSTECLESAIINLYIKHWTYWDEHTEDYQRLKQEIPQLEAEIEPLEEFIAEKNAQADSVQNEISLLETELAIKTNELEEKKAELQALLDEASEDSSLEISRLQTEIAELEDQIEPLEKSITEKNAQVDSIKNELTLPEKELAIKTSHLEQLKAELQALLDEKIYATDESSLETIRTVMTDAIEAMWQQTVWSIAYYACDGQVFDDAYHRIMEIVKSGEYIHPDALYQILCDYGITPPEELENMVTSYAKLEKELPFLPQESDDAYLITWSELNEELQRVFGTIEHSFSFRGTYYVENEDPSGEPIVRYYNSTYIPEETSMPIDVIARLKEEIKNCEETIGSAISSVSHGIQFSCGEDDSAQHPQPWGLALGFIETFGGRISCDLSDSDGVHVYKYTLAERQFSSYFDVCHTPSWAGFEISVGVGSEDNFNESGLTVRQTRFKEAQENISYYQNLLIKAATVPNKDIVTLLMQIIAGEENVSVVTISEYLNDLQQQLEYGEAMIYQAALAMAASDYAEDNLYEYAYSARAPKDALGMLVLLRNYNFDETVLMAFAERMMLLNNQNTLLNQSMELLTAYQNPDTSAWITEEIPASEAVAVLNPVLDTNSLTLYGYVAQTSSEEIPLPGYIHTVLYAGYGSASVQVNGNQITIVDKEPVTVYGDVYLSLGNSLSGAMLAFAKSQTEAYTPPTDGLKSEEIAVAENGVNRHSYTIDTSEKAYTLNLRTADAPYALITNLWRYTGNTEYISANQTLVDIYGYSIDLSFRTNAEDSDLLLQTDATNRIYGDGESQTDAGAGSYMKFTIVDSTSYSTEMAKAYMGCLRVVFTDTNTGYIYGYSALDMHAAEVNGDEIKAPLRLYDKVTGVMLEGDRAQYICHLDQNVEKNLTVYVYLDGAMVSQSIVAASGTQTLKGEMGLQFSSSAELKPAVIEDMR